MADNTTGINFQQPLLFVYEFLRVDDCGIKITGNYNLF